MTQNSRRAEENPFLPFANIARASERCPGRGVPAAAAGLRGRRGAVANPGTYPDPGRTHAAQTSRGSWKTETIRKCTRKPQNAVSCILHATKHTGCEDREVWWWPLVPIPTRDSSTMRVPSQLINEPSQAGHPAAW